MLLENIVDFNYAALIIFIMTAFYVVYRKVYKAYSSQGKRRNAKADDKGT